MATGKLEQALKGLDAIISDLEEVTTSAPSVVTLKDDVKTSTENGNTTQAKKNQSKPGKKPAKPASQEKSLDENEENFNKSLLMVARIDEIEVHPDSEKLFICKVEFTPGEVCQVVTGLQKFYKVEDLRKRKVAIIKNLKTAKLAGTLSEAMILAGAVPTDDGGEIVKVLDPPSDSSIGDRVYLEGGSPSDSPSKQLSSKVWDKIVAQFKVQDGVAAFAGKNLVTSCGEVLVPGLPNGATIH